MLTKDPYFLLEVPTRTSPFSLLNPSWPMLQIRFIVHADDYGSNFPQFLINSDPWKNGQFGLTTKSTFDVLV